VFSPISERGLALSRERESQPGRHLELNVRALLAERGFTLAGAERATGMHRGYLSRVLSVRRGGWPAFGAVVALSDAAKIDLGHLAQAFRITIQAAWEQRCRAREAELLRRRLE
jgi:hypothetical protein